MGPEPGADRSGRGASSERGDGAGNPGADGPDEEIEELDELLEELQDLEEVVDSPAEREQVRRARRRVIETVRTPRPFGRVIRGFDRADAAEALLGSVLFGIPILVEDGTLAAGAYIATRPVYFAATVLFGVGTVVGILYVAEIQDVRIHEPLFGVVPRRLVAVLGIAFVTAVALATVWGRVDWAEPTVALAQVVVAAVPMAIGAALGDILPGS